MKKKSESRISRVFKRVINIRSWMDWDRLKTSTSYLGTAIKKLFIPQEAEEKESFKEAVKNLNLSEVDLQNKQKSLFRLSMLMLGVAFVLLIYTGYQLYYIQLKAVLVSLIITLIALALAFRYHFWYFQIKKHKLGCSFKEWYKQGLLGEKE